MGESGAVVKMNFSRRTIGQTLMEALLKIFGLPWRKASVNASKQKYRSSVFESAQAST
jgi:hypothetical protein